ncbi:ankyrin repeat domain-containing protein [Alienimonas californiensis]|uniref:Ankyrin repeats (3 copies) n=1 Tax=Alienimonas californiensis TaxID=2527989 RepID=A0A517P514_9PLAN|nr:ankyrin repeat domain-containing protein [Alienimonas californiensis]QDT14451.1 Ankyrin repeats (3 copies) [Alienimonas californiensis]
MVDPTRSEFHGVRADSPQDALGIAAANSDLAAINALLADGVAVDGVAGYSQSTALCSAAGAGAKRATELLIRSGADVNRPGAHDMTPLMQACSCGGKKGEKVAALLLDAGADVNAVRAADEMTALKFAVGGGTPETVRGLVDAGAVVDGPPGEPLTALMIAARNNNVKALKVLIDAGADPHRTCGLPWAENRTALGLAELEKQRQAAAYLRTLEPGRAD